MIKMIIGKPYVNDSSMHYNYCYYKDKIFFLSYEDTYCDYIYIF